MSSAAVHALPQHFQQSSPNASPSSARRPQSQRPSTGSGPSHFDTPSAIAARQVSSSSTQASPNHRKISTAYDSMEPAMPQQDYTSTHPHLNTDSPSQARRKELDQPSSPRHMIPDTLPREDSAILSRLVIDDPQADAARERDRQAEAQAMSANHHHEPSMSTMEAPDEASAPRRRQEHLKSSHPRKETKFGEYILGQTLGEGEFGKVKMGWKKEGGVQVAIKLIRRETLGNNPNRLPKIYREISILRGLAHPNIVRLHEMVETERHIGIILEYASGGELFDYILNHRYLKDNAARRLFAQLVSGVGYLHKKGIVHRDLKLENLLLDRNRNIIITDFGFANTFNPDDELGEDIEYNLNNKDFVSKMGLEHVQPTGHRRGDLMQTSCGSPCYAAPELVVSDSLYTGRKVDVWSCGVILYAMLAGYLPFDDDPANPEGDNINLLYKYIVSTPLTFPEYVTPHARDLLRRILVPDPRKRADLFEVARHSWLSEYAHVVGFITSTTTTSADIVDSAIPTGKSPSRQIRPPATDATTEDQYDVPQLARSASVREPSKPSQISVPGGLINKNVPINETETKTPRDAKRRTVQVEYVAPNSQTVRQQPISTSLPTSVALAQPGPPPSSQGRSRARGDSASGPVAVNPASYDPSTSAQRSQPRPATQSAMSPPVRPHREPARAVTDSTPFTVGSPTSNARPTTSGSRLPSRGNSYGQPALATVAATNAEGRFSQPNKSSGYMISGPGSQEGSKRNSYTRPVSQHLPADYQTAPQQPAERQVRGHKRSNTMESFTTKLFGRTNSRRQSATPQEIANARQEREKANRMYPPVSMKNAMPHSGEDLTRPSTESSRRSFGYNRKNSETAGPRSSRRFSFLPMSFSRMSFSGASGPESAEGGRRASVQANARSRPASKQSPIMAFGQGRSRSPSQSTTSSSIPVVQDSNVDARRKMTHQPVRGATAPDLTKMQDSGFSQQQQFSRQQQQEQQYNNYTPPQSSAGRPRQENLYTPSQSAESQASDSITQTPRQKYPAGFNEAEPAVAKPQQRQQAVLQKNRKFGDAYEGHGNGGSSGGARRVMDWFRKRGKDRSN
ncbi:kinase-like protein [Aureobasidium subglaciale]|nr:kinase-like protein [Aureobasidium subglaciale]KAI5213454.1 kinase-like protein [Aureobasidium subglaciale]KAI5214996.1 kinase-like protein [Aureobasidium subglaciale]KAI5236659.1 kinase-like protein [Aureobasidium subglaciale]KAI5253162.1 kinase-like protein [Aureobasidium subglaciale]